LVLGTYGFRAERAEVVAVCLPRRGSRQHREQVADRVRASFPAAELVAGPRLLRREYPADDLTALGVPPRRTRLARTHRAFHVCWLVGILALYSLVLWPEAAGDALRAGGWVVFVLAVTGWQALLVRRAG